MKLKKTSISKNPKGDSRTAKQIPLYKDFQEANKSHRYDVKKMMYNISEMLKIAGNMHDWTKNDKTILEEMFYCDLVDTMNGEMIFTDGKWHQIHCDLERHHLNKRCPDDVNLIDVLEMIADCVCAGAARSGKVEDIKLDIDILKKAFDNTVKMCAESVEVINDNEI